MVSARLYSSVGNVNRAFYCPLRRIPAPGLDIDANLTKSITSRLSRNRHTLLERSLATITHGVSSLTVQHRSEIAGSDLRIASDVYPNYVPFRGEERDTTDFCAEDLYLVQSDHSNSSRSWSVSQEQKRVKRTLRESGSVIEAFLGTIRAKSTTYLQTSRQTGDLVPHHEQDQYESKTSYIIHPASWLINLGINYGLHLGFLSSSAQGWKSTLKTFCPVPDDALIFVFCRQGNVPAVRDLLSGGYASIRDTDSWGYTPLHVSFAGETDLSFLSISLYGIV